MLTLTMTVQNTYLLFENTRVERYNVFSVRKNASINIFFSLHPASHAMNRNNMHYILPSINITLRLMQSRSLVICAFSSFDRGFPLESCKSDISS